MSFRNKWPINEETEETEILREEPRGVICRITKKIFWEILYFEEFFIEK